MSRRLLTKVLVGGLAAGFGLVATGAAANACGGLVGENGTIRLTRTSTLAAYHDGVERYVTSFEFSGEGAELGSIIPLPDVPTSVERGGDWTLQRLQREVAPPVRQAAATSASAGKALADAGSVAGGQDRRARTSRSSRGALRLSENGR